MDDGVGVATRSWAFRAEIEVDKESIRGHSNAELEFEGLDTFAEVHLVR